MLLKRTVARASKQGVRQRRRRLFVEALEVRQLLAVVGPDVEGPAVDAPAVAGQENIRVIVQLSERGKADSVLAGLGSQASNVRRMSELPILILELPEPAIAGLANSPHVVTVQRDEAVPPALASTIPVINADDVQTLGYTGAGTTIAIIDTGIDDDHNFFGTNGSRIIAERCFSGATGGNQVSLCPNGMTTDTDADVVGVAACLDDLNNNICDHGTHVAGIAAGSAATDVDPPLPPGNGVAPGANIIAIQAFTRFNDAASCGTNPVPCVLSYTSDQISALDAVIALDSANPTWNIVSVNMSLGGGNNATACDADTRKVAIDTLLAQGVTTVIAAGNNGFNAAVGAPGCISTAFTVGSTTDTDAISGFSNRGTLLDVFAPGSFVDSSEPDDTYGNKSGTSMATPHVAGALAVLRQAYPARTIADLMNDLVTTGVPINYVSDGANVTTPRINLLAALQAPNTPPVITADNASVNVNEGSSATNSGSATDADGTITSIVASRGTVSLSGSTWNWSETPADDHPNTGTPSDNFAVTVTVTDDKGETDSVTFQLTVNNVPPTIATPMTLSANSINEGQSVTVSGTFTDPALGVGTETFSGTATWSDGANSTVIVGNGTFSTTRTFTDDHPNTGTLFDIFTVSITITDDDTGSDTETSPNLTVNNVDPVIAGLASDATFADKAVEGELVKISATFTDVGVDDTHTAQVDWGDGTIEPAIVIPGPPGSGTITASHAYAAGGIYTITVKLTDDDTGDDEETTTAVVTGVGLNNGILYIIGSAGDDDVSVNQTGNGVIKVKATFIPEDFRSFDAADVDKIISYLCEGDDEMTISAGVTKPAIIHGDGGNDHLNAGGGPTVLLGGAGDDKLVGQLGRNIIIGGSGLDRLIGGNEDDVLIGGSTDIDNDDDALMQLAMAWNANVGYPVRVEAVKDAINIIDDDEEDTLTGSSGRDLFFAGLGDILTDKKRNEDVL